MRTVAGAIGGLLVWAGLWALVNRLLSQRFDFLRHLACASLAMAAAMGARSLAEYAEFLLSSGRLGSAIELGGIWLSTLALLSAHLAILRASTRRQRRWWALAGTAALAGLLSLASTEELVDPVSEVPITTPLKPLGGIGFPRSR